MKETFNWYFIGKVFLGFSVISKILDWGGRISWSEIIFLYVLISVLEENDHLKKDNKLLRKTLKESIQPDGKQSAQ